MATEAINRAFNQGCQARLGGRPRLACPYAASRQKNLSAYWNLGWWDVHHHWGSGAKWPVLSLPPADAGVVLRYATEKKQ